MFCLIQIKSFKRTRRQRLVESSHSTARMWATRAPVKRELHWVNKHERGFEYFNDEINRSETNRATDHSHPVGHPSLVEREQSLGGHRLSPAVPRRRVVSASAQCTNCMYRLCTSQCWEGTRVLVLEYCTRVLLMSTRKEYFYCESTRYSSTFLSTGTRVPIFKNYT